MALPPFAKDLPPAPASAGAARERRSSRRANPSASGPAVGADEPGLGEVVAVHGVEQLLPGGAGVEAQHGVQGVELEDVAVVLPRRRGRAAVADLAEVVRALAAAVGQRRRRLDAVEQL